jgi:hypothetical protein
VAGNNPSESVGMGLDPASNLSTQQQSQIRSEVFDKGCKEKWTYGWLTDGPKDIHP